MIGYTGVPDAFRINESCVKSKPDDQERNESEKVFIRSISFGLELQTEAR